MLIYYRENENMILKTAGLPPPSEKEHKMKTNILIEIAARAESETPFEAHIDGIDVHSYRFDLMKVVGDFVIVNVPMAFSDMTSARLKLFELLQKDYQ